MAHSLIKENQIWESHLSNVPAMTPYYSNTNKFHPHEGNNKNISKLKSRKQRDNVKIRTKSLCVLFLCAPPSLLSLGCFVNLLMHSHFFFLDFCLQPTGFSYHIAPLHLFLPIFTLKIFIIHFSCQLFPFLLHLLTPTVHRLLKGLTFPVNSKHFTTFLGTIKMSCII